MAITVGATGRSGRAKIATCISGIGVGLSGADVAPKLSKRRAEVFFMEGVGLLKQVDILEPLADCQEPPAASLLATLWVAAFCKGAQQQDEAILSKIVV